jgi:glycosyltransferase involved in cell wall biosynthesis
VRILHTESSVNWGGQEYRILDQMIWLAAHGHHAALAARPRSALSLKAKAHGLAVHDLPYLGHYNPALIHAARRLVRRERFDIVDTHGSRDGATHGFGRDIAPVIRTRHLSTPMKPKLHRRLQWQWGCDRAIATAQVIKDDLARKKFLPAARIDVVGEWAADEFFDITHKDAHRAAVRAEFSIPTNRPLVAVVGMLRGDKAQEILIKVISELKSRGRRAAALIVGSDTDSAKGYENFLRATADQLDVDDDVRFTGYRDDVARLTQAADILTITSVAVEAQSRTAPQAFAACTPVIASNIGGVAELVADGATGRLVAPGDVTAYADAIERTLDDPTTTNRIVDAARALALRDLTMDGKMAATLDSYRAALLSSGRSVA